MSRSLRQKFNIALWDQNGTRIHRLIRHPIRLVYFKMLQLIAEQLGIAFAVEAKPFWGDQMRVVLPASVAPEVCKYGYYEADLTGILLDHLKPGMIFFDIGAHFGYFTLLAAKIVGAYGQVYSFEPTPRTFEVLATNARGKANIHVNNRAVWSNSQSIEFYDYGNRYSAFNSMFQPRLPLTIRTKLKSQLLVAQAITLDEFARDNNVMPHLVKIDAESAEFQVLLGMDYLLTKARPLITIEVGFESEQATSQTAQALALVSRYSYDPFILQQEKWVPYSVVSTANSGGNVLLVPRQ